jgi:integrase
MKLDEARAQLGDGRDPAIVKRLRVEANLRSARNTFEIVAREWHAMTKTQWAPIHGDDVLRSLERDVFPAIGNLPIAELKPPLIMAVLTAIEDRGAIETAKRVRQRVSAVFVYAIAKGLADGALRKNWALRSNLCEKDGSRPSSISIACAV